MPMTTRLFWPAAVLSLLLASCTTTDASDTGTGNEAEFDFIVVGGGTAGCVVAGRLAENPRWRVLVLEAGPADFEATRVPARWEEVLLNPDTVDPFTSIEQDTLGGRSVGLRWGRGLGGCSTHNLQGMVRGAPHDYRAWDKLLGGGTEWNWSEALRYFKKCEFYDHDEGPLDLRSHDPSHPFYITDVPYKDPLSVSFYEASIARGFAANSDYNGDSMAGISWMQVNTRNGERVTTKKAYLDPVAGNPNVTVRTEAMVTKVLFANTNAGPTADGVAYLKDGREQVAKLAAGGEVLLAASTINSPKILMLSGVGPREHLEEHGIPVIADNPGVGRGLQDHTTVVMAWRAKDVVTKEGQPVRVAAAAGTKDPGERARLLAQFAEGQGALTTTGFETTLFFSSPWANDLHPIRESADDVPPDLELWLSTTFLCKPPSLDPESLDPNITRLSFVLFHNVPGHRKEGVVRLASKDPLVEAEWDTALLNDPKQVKAIAYGIEVTRKIVGQMTYPGTSESLAVHELWPGAEYVGPGLEDYVRRESGSGYHIVGSCQMGKQESSCVDLRLRVRGVRGVRVVDGSVMPRVPRGNTTLPTIMVAEKAADLIKEDRRSP